MNQTVAAGAPAVFSVSAVGTQPLDYQWFKGAMPLVDGTNLSGTLTATMSLAHAQAGGRGQLFSDGEQCFGPGHQLECRAGGELRSRHPDSARQPDGAGGLGGDLHGRVSGFSR